MPIIVKLELLFTSLNEEESSTEIVVINWFNQTGRETWHFYVDLCQIYFSSVLRDLP